MNREKIIKIIKEEEGKWSGVNMVIGSKQVLEALNSIVGQIEYRLFMVVGFRDFPVNPNEFGKDLLGDKNYSFTEADNPYVFGSREYAEKFINELKEKCKDGSCVRGESDPAWELRIVELI